MSRTLSQRFKAAAQASSAGAEVLVTLAEIIHSKMPAPLRLTNDRVQKTYASNIYLPFPFTFDLADVVEGSVPTGMITFDGTDLSILANFASVDSPIVFNITVSLAATPDSPELGVISFKCRDVEILTETVACTLSYDMPADEAYPAHHMDQAHFPMLFTQVVA